MNIGIKEIGIFIPDERRENPSSVSPSLGIERISRFPKGMSVAEACGVAFENLKLKGEVPIEQVELVFVVTQNPGRNIPHVSAQLHGALMLSAKCACVDISLGCSGYVQALAMAKAFMEAHGLSLGLVFTADSYSEILDPNDQGTAHIFGDAATATLLSRAPVLSLSQLTFGTDGKQCESLALKDGHLRMDGRAVYNFVVRNLPVDVHDLLKRSGLTVADVDRFIFHQASKRVVEKLIETLELPTAKVPFLIRDYGNTISSSIPLALAEEIGGSSRHILISGFGVGLSWASQMLARVDV